MLAWLCAAAGLALAAHYPIGPSPWAAVLFVAVAAWAYRWPRGWLIALPAVVPVVGFAPWTGWITFEELDMIVLAVAVGGYLRLSRRPREVAAGITKPQALTWLLAALFAASLIASALRGFADAGGFTFGWFQGYHGPMNSVRLAKGYLLALLMLPLWNAQHRAAPALAAQRLTTGLALGLAAASLAALWERLAFSGLLDFSDDYRTTALFWEMHVGGAAFDGFLALTVPFALRELQGARTALRSLGAVAVLLVASYACLTTFSRGVYLAVPLGAVAALWLASRQDRIERAVAQHRVARLWPAVWLALGFMVAAAWMFPTSGYRGLLALLGAFAVLLRVGRGPHRRDARSWVVVVALGVAVSTLAVLVAWWQPKGAYVAYAAALALALAATASSRRSAWLAPAGFAGVLVGVGLVSLHWGGDAALWRALPVIVSLGLAAVVIDARGKALGPATLRGQATVLGGLLAASVLVGVLNGGAYMTGRFATSGEDLDGRVEHWRDGLAMLRTPAQWAFGMGLGRYPANFVLQHSATDAPGDYALRGAAGDRHLVLVGGKQVIGWGELLRVSQRVQPPQQPVTVRLKVRAAQPMDLHLEVCEKHLLYNAACLVKEVAVPATGANWRVVQTLLDGGGVSRGPWYAPRLISFSIGNATRDTQVDVDDLELRGADGRDLLVNGDFSRGMAHWFFSSDRNHLPWHLKNMFVHTLFDQGGFGLALLACMLFGALWRITRGSARGHALAPAITGAIVGFVVVGLFDSLLDVPRDAFVFYFLLLLALTLRTPRSGDRRLPGILHEHPHHADPNMPTTSTTLRARDAR